MGAFAPAKTGAAHHKVIFRIMNPTKHAGRLLCWHI